MKPARYHLLSAAAKSAMALARAREPAITCPQCDTQVMPVDMLTHLQQRCAGRRDPGAGAKWLSWREARALGVSRPTLSRWAKTGEVRTAGEPMDRRYLLRDLALKIAQRWGFRRR